MKNVANGYDDNFAIMDTTEFRHSINETTHVVAKHMNNYDLIRYTSLCR